MPVTYIPLATQTLGSAAASVTFSSISAAYTDLVLVGQFTGSAANNQINIQVGNSSVDTGSNYSFTQLYGTGSATASARSTSQTSILLGYTDTATTSIDSNLIANIQNYSNTTTNKTILSRGNSPARATAAVVGLWRSTSAINIITVSTASSTFAAGSTFSLYGIASTAVGAKATGGTIFKDSNYYYHAFTASGTFTPTQSISADILVVAGGGGGGRTVGGGGGAGGLLGFTSQSLTATGYTITVGAGGAGGTSFSGTAGTGSDSQFGALTLVKGGGGGGGGDGINGLTGGSGGGGGGASPATTGGSGTSGQGFAGSGWGGTGLQLGGGGGGSSAAATNKNGANGVTTYSAWGLATGTGQNVNGTVYYAGGGGAGTNEGAGGSALIPGAGGFGGGATGKTLASAGVPTAATANTGGGGAGSGGSGDASNGSAGGSGLVIVRYPI